MSVKTRANKQSGATIKDVANAAGVSAMTVSRVLNAEPNVRPATRERVQSAILELNYRPNLSARNLARANAYFIGLLYDNPSAGYISELLIGALNRCRSSGYHLVLESCGAADEDWTSQIADMLRTSNFDGVIMPPPVCDHPDVLDAVAEAGIPYVRIAPDTDIDRAPCILTDDRAAARRMTEYLIGLGHTRIGFILGPTEHGASRERHAGFLEGLAAHGIESDPALIAAGAFTYKSGLEAADVLLSLEQRPTAIFASNDDMAVAVIALAHKHALDVPRDLTVVGFDDTQTATAIWPQLTTVRQPISDMSSAAVELLASHLNGDENAVARCEIRSEIVIRDSSTGPAR
ncbi:transcriptional regulator [Maricaulis sp. W15]|uniref:LacI family DNA-binding transcriptional regulator n=1 Tax=Maricaulis sp. W15 TaxID=1772333 RepID=UPI0009490664|nr:LacI family DNA-binding transcriptional regulator [Maricaulis sp. W15]OLF81120.1 transcriptional regulator [Maricaulis sp. W15]